jgi:hypothetical protein
MIDERDAHPVKAKMLIPCPVTHCTVTMPNGFTQHSRMQLHLYGPDGHMLRRPYDDGPYYRCEREGCEFRKHPRGLHEMNSEWIRDADRWDGDKHVRENADLERMWEVLI